MVEEKTELGKYIEEVNSYFKGKTELSGAYLVLCKYVTEWTSTDKKIANLLNNAYIYGLLEEGKAEIVLEAIEWLRKEKEILKKQYPHQEEEFNTYLNCLKEFKKIVEATVDNGFSYYDGLVVNAVEVEIE